MDDEARARSIALGDAIQHALAARIVGGEDLGLFGVGLDALSSMMRNNPDTIPEFGPMLALVVEGFNYVLAGERTPRVDGLLGGDLGL